MAQAGLHLPATVGEAAGVPDRCSRTSATNSRSRRASARSRRTSRTCVVDGSRSRSCRRSSLLDEVGTGTDPNEGGALATAIVQHFRQRGALIIATTHFDAVKTWGIGTEGRRGGGVRASIRRTSRPPIGCSTARPAAASRSKWRSGSACRQSVIAAARGYLSDDQKRLQAHLSRLDAQARALESDRVKLERERRTFNETERRAVEAREVARRARRGVRRSALNERARRTTAPGAARRRCGDRSV